MKKRGSSSRKFKREAAGMDLDQGLSYREVCCQLDLRETQLVTSDCFLTQTTHFQRIELYPIKIKEKFISNRARMPRKR